MLLSIGSIQGYTLTLNVCMHRHSEFAGLIRKECGICNSSLPNASGGYRVSTAKKAATSITVTHVLYQPKHRTLLLKNYVKKKENQRTFPLTFTALLLNQVVQSLTGPGLLLHTSLHLREVDWPKATLILH